MHRARRTRILVLGSPGLRSRLASEVETSRGVREVAAAAEGLVMLTVREGARGRLFHLGEVLVTEAKAQLGEHLGIGIIAGHDPRAAWELAVIDAAYNAGDPACAGWTAVLEEEERRLGERRRLEEGRLLATRVDFASMDRA
jgi:alpha-D-ribose 1-methylphosphonate 5-triphosphate synthase subunit PhnG